MKSKSVDDSHLHFRTKILTVSTYFRFEFSNIKGYLRLEPKLDIAAFVLSASRGETRITPRLHQWLTKADGLHNRVEDFQIGVKVSRCTRIECVDNLFIILGRVFQQIT